MFKYIFFKLPTSSRNIPFTVILIAFTLLAIMLQSCTHNESYIKSISNDITTNGFLNDNCYQCITTAKPDPGIEGLVASRESAHINLMKTLETQCYDNLYSAVLQLQNITIADSSLQECLGLKLKPYIDKRVIVTTYYNEDYSKTAVVRIYDRGLKQKLASLSCR